MQTLEEIISVQEFSLPPAQGDIRYAPICQTHPKEKPRVAWRGELYSARSFAHVNRESILALSRRGFAVEAIPTDTRPEPEVLQWPSTKAIQGHIATGSRPEVLIEYLAEEVPPRAMARQVYLVVWESFLLPQRFVEPIVSRNAQVWVAASCVAEACLRAGISSEKVFVLPHGVDTEVFHPGVLPRELGLSGRFVFLFSGVAHYRKGVDVALRAFLEEFSANEPVSLVVKDAPASYGWGANLGAEIAALSLKDPRIVYLVERLPSSEMAKLYAASDVVLAPSRGEGFNLPVLEAMSCGRPVISTPTGVACDLLPEKELFLTEATPVLDPSWREGHSVLTSAMWLRPSIPSLRQAMRRLYEDRSLAAQIGDAARKKATSYHWDNIGAMMESLLCM